MKKRKERGVGKKGKSLQSIARNHPARAKASETCRDQGVHRGVPSINHKPDKDDAMASLSQFEGSIAVSRGAGEHSMGNGSTCSDGPWSKVTVDRSSHSHCSRSLSVASHCWLYSVYSRHPMSPVCFLPCRGLYVIRAFGGGAVVLFRPIRTVSGIPYRHTQFRSIHTHTHAMLETHRRLEIHITTLYRNGASCPCRHGKVLYHWSILF